jgi:hypothetical protein
MQMVKVDLKRSHYGATVEEVSEAFNVGNGTSALLGMAVDPEHRATVEAYREAVDWKLANTEGEQLAKWSTVANHLDIVLSASRLMHDHKVKTAALQATRDQEA